MLKKLSRGVLCLEVDKLHSLDAENPISPSRSHLALSQGREPRPLSLKATTGTRLLQQRPPEGSLPQIDTGVEYPGVSRKSQLRAPVRDSQLFFLSSKPLFDSGTVPVSSDINLFPCSITHQSLACLLQLYSLASFQGRCLHPRHHKNPFDSRNSMQVV